ncbi:MAG: TMEM43 family protein, partial [Reyranellales bacterium]
DNNRMWTWLIRAGGCVLMFIGFGLILGPIGVLADVIPILGDVVRAGTGLVGLLCTSVVAPVVIAIGWFAYRPIVAVVVLVLGAALAYGAIHLSRLRAAARKAPIAV